MSLFTHIKNQLSILEVVGSYATLKKHGVYYKGICPFHYEKTASFTVSPHKEIFYCFGCHTGGDLIAFIAKAEHCTQLEAAQLLAERYNIEIPTELHVRSNTQQSYDEKKRYFALCNLVKKWLSHQLPKNTPAISYLHNRSITNVIIKQYNLGYFPGGTKSIQILIDYIRKEDFLVDDLLKANIVAQSKTTLYSPFEERIIFPINDHLGNTCGFGGRVFRQHDERPKYYNSREHTFFSKGSLFFGLDVAKPDIQKTNTAFLVEGYTDCLLMATHGYLNTVATLGTACTIEHLKGLSRFAEILYVMYDADSAGKHAMTRLTELCWHVSLDLRIIVLPSGYDPASFLTSKQDLKPLIDNAQDIFEFFLETSSSQFAEQTLNQKLSHLRNFLATLEGLQDELKRDIILAKAADKFEVPVQSLKKELFQLKKGLPSSQANTPSIVAGQEEESINKILKEIPLLEKKLFSAILNNTNLVGHEDNEYLRSYLHESLQELYKKLMKLHTRDTQADFVMYFEMLTDQEKALISRLVLECHEYEEPENYAYLLEQFQKKMWKSFVADTKIHINRARQAHDQERLKKILTQFQELKEKLLRKGLI